VTQPARLQLLLAPLLLLVLVAVPALRLLLLLPLLVHQALTLPQGSQQQVQEWPAAAAQRQPPLPLPQLLYHLPGPQW
jgi:hypothetical protein